MDQTSRRPIVRIAATCSALAVTLALTTSLAPRPAHADELSDLAAKIEQTAADYESATAKAEELNGKVEENTAKISEIEATLPAQKEKSNVAIKNLYVYSNQGFRLIDTLLDAENINDFLNNIEYVTQVQERNMSEVEKTESMIEELNVAQSSLESDKQAADEEKQRAETALEDAKQARAEAQQRALERAQAEAAAAAAQAQQLAAKQAEEQAAVIEAGTATQAETVGGTVTAEEIVNLEVPAADTVDWSSDKAGFVAQWAGRIDAYLSGSPLAGQGATFASAAWDYGVDPRWSPAISNTESSKGLYCFADHNAWGWGSSNWGSWEEAINAHVRGLANGYGPTITYEAAAKYCPPNAVHWYESTLSEMNSI